GRLLPAEATTAREQPPHPARRVPPVRARSRRHLRHLRRDMAGDYTRMSFKSSKDHSGVLMQQGRVTLDADWNELVDVVDYRLRAEIVDTLGRCVFSRETPDAFRIGLAGGVLTIGRGRALVDGILAECHGAGAHAYDPVLGELYGVDPVDYLD